MIYKPYKFYSKKPLFMNIGIIFINRNLRPQADEKYTTLYASCLEMIFNFIKEFKLKLKND